MNRSEQLAQELAAAFDEDFVNYKHLVHKAHVLLNQGWMKADPEISYGVCFPYDAEVEEIHVCDSREDALELLGRLKEEGCPEPVYLVSKTAYYAHREMPWEEVE